jgi:hypothetical protein
VTLIAVIRVAAPKRARVEKQDTIGSAVVRVTP